MSARSSRPIVHALSCCIADEARSSPTSIWRSTSITTCEEPPLPEGSVIAMAAAVSGTAFSFDMTGLPTDTLPAAEFLVRHMYRPVELGANQTHFAIAETAVPIGGDSWFWSDDNAKVLEFLSRPELWRRFPTETAEILRFVRAMCRGPLIFRRVSPPRLELIERRDTRSRYRH